MQLDGLWKPDLRGKIEQSIKDISLGNKSKEEVCLDSDSRQVGYLGAGSGIDSLSLRFHECRLEVLRHDRCNVQIFCQKRLVVLHSRASFLSTLLRAAGGGGGNAPLLQAQSAAAPSNVRGRGTGRGRRGGRGRGRSRSSPGNSRTGGRGRGRAAAASQDIPMCPVHNQPVLVFTSKTANNPGRVFYKCSNESERNACLPFKWADEFGM